MSFVWNGDLEALKTEIDRFGRKEYCKEIGISYGVLTNKLNGFSVITEKMSEKIHNLVEDFKNQNPEFKKLNYRIERNRSLIVPIAPLDLYSLMLMYGILVDHSEYTSELKCTSNKLYKYESKIGTFHWRNRKEYSLEFTYNFLPPPFSSLLNKGLILY
jgi:hypothetical protein